MSSSPVPYYYYKYVRTRDDWPRKGFFRFLELPAELRNEVYKLLLPEDQCAKISSFSFFRKIDTLSAEELIKYVDRIRTREATFHLAILSTCRQIYAEATPLLYKTTFRFEDDGAMADFTKEHGNARLLQHVEMFYDFRNIPSCYPGLEYCVNLKSLCLIPWSRRLRPVQSALRDWFEIGRLWMLNVGDKEGNKLACLDRLSIDIERVTSLRWHWVFHEKAEAESWRAAFMNKLAIQLEKTQPRTVKTRASRRGEAE